MGLFCGVIAGILAILLAAILIPFNLRRLKFARLAVALPAGLRREILYRIDRAGSEDGTPLVLLIPAALPVKPDNLDGELASVTLQSPPLPEDWGRRRIRLRREAGGPVLASSELAEGSVESGRGTSIARGIRLEHVRVPRSRSRERSAYDPSSLLRSVDGLRELLSKHADAPADQLLPYVLVPGIGTFEIDVFHLGLMGGKPELIQDRHDARCSECSRRMRFLFQLGAFLGLGGDAPVVYVYGCDSHLDQVRAFVDMH